MSMTRVRWAVVLVTLLCPLLGRAGSTDPIATCRPGVGDTILCKDREDFCTDQGVNFIFDPLNYCDEDQRTMIDPTYPCNCNILCVDSIPEGEKCYNRYTSTYPSTLCAPGLDCILSGDSGGYVCARNPTKPCVNMTIQYEEALESGTLGPGMLYPNCNDVGQWDSMQCSASSTCYCTDTDGNRLFGEAPYTERDTMDCKCALHWHRNERLGLADGLRCLANGNLDSLQCNSDFCYCYNSTVGAITVGPYDQSMIEIMDCFDPLFHNGNYSNPCTIAEDLFNAENPDNSDILAVGPGMEPYCGLDGYYASIQLLDETYFCSDKFGEPIEDFTFVQDEASYSNCNCATRRHLMREAGLESFLPPCCKNGNFKPYQTRGLYSYCVDDNGNQVGEAVALTDAETLSCDDVDC